MPGRLDLRSRRDAITERRGIVQTEERRGGRERGEGKEGKTKGKKKSRLSLVLHVFLLLTLSSFFCTRTTLPQPAG